MLWPGIDHTLTSPEIRHGFSRFNLALCLGFFFFLPFPFWPSIYFCGFFGFSLFICFVLTFDRYTDLKVYSFYHLCMPQTVDMPILSTLEGSTDFGVPIGIQRLCDSISEHYSEEQNLTDLFRPNLSIYHIRSFIIISSWFNSLTIMTEPLPV